MSEFKRLEDWIQRWIRKAAYLYETETASEKQITVWGEFGNSHELPDELKRLLNDKDPHDDSGTSERETNENEVPEFLSSWVQNLMKPTLDRLESLEKEVIDLKKELAKESPDAKAKKKTKPGKSTSSVTKKPTTRVKKKPSQTRKPSSPKHKSPTS